jgi:3-oxoacyl-[acyl-carrier-protein] synthase-1
VAEFNDRSGVFAGSGCGNYQCNYDFLPLLAESGGSLKKFGEELGNTVNPMWLLRNLPNNVLCHVGIQFGFKGTNACVTNQCLGGASAVAEAAHALREGEADRAAVAGHDAPLDVETIVNFHRVGLLAREALRPFDAARDGTVLGEGAGACVLETLEGAVAREAGILGEFLGSGSTTEASGVLDISSDGDGVARAIELALEDAGLTADAIGMVVAHGNGTTRSDASEVVAFRRVFRDRIPPVTGFKWATGHTIAACGIVDLLLGLRALERGILPGIATLQRLDPSLDPFPVSRTDQTPTAPVALVICRGFGGMNLATLVGSAPTS